MNVKAYLAGFDKAEKIARDMAGDEKYHCFLGGEEFLLRIADGEDYEEKKREFEHLKMLSDAGRPVPKCIELDKSDDGSQVFTLLSWVKGEEAEKLIPNMDTIVKALSCGIVGGLKLVLNFVVGIIAAIYVLLSKDKFSAQSKKVAYAALGKERGNKFIAACDYVDGVFGGFISGKIADSLIIGLICFIFCTIVNMPYAMLISVVVGITNMIPFFGPFIGAIPSSVLVLVDSPKMCLVFVIFIIILQQVDGNIIGTLILGDTTGLSSFWVLFAIMVGGNLFGFVGMLLGVPAFACIYTFFAMLIRDVLKKRGLTNETDFYVSLRGIDENDQPIKGVKRRFQSVSANKKRERIQKRKEAIEKKAAEALKRADHTSTLKKESKEEKEEAKEEKEEVKESEEKAEEKKTEEKKTQSKNKK